MRFFLLSIILLFAAAAFAHPDHPADSLSQVANKAYAEGRWSECAALFSEAIEHGVNDPGTIYNCACCFALANNADQAFHWLDSAIARDFTNVQHLQNDADLKALHSDSRWRAIVEKMRLAQLAYLQRETMNAELFFLMKDDQLDRRTADSAGWDSVAKRDAQRLVRVKQLLQDSALRVSQDYFNAALIAQHGTDSSDYLLAHQLARKAVDLDSANLSAKWLSCAAYDRYLHSSGKPQIYGTQFRFDQTSGQWTLEPLDAAAATDEERAYWNVPPLSEARERCVQMNRKP